MKRHKKSFLIPTTLTIALTCRSSTEKADPSSQVLAGRAPLNRLELTQETASRKERYKKIVLDHGAVDRLLVEVFLQAHPEEPKEIILDLDATDDPLGSRKGASSMATMGTIAICRCISSAESSCCVRGCDHQTSMRRREV